MGAQETVHIGTIFIQPLVATLAAETVWIRPIRPQHRSQSQGKFKLQILQSLIQATAFASSLAVTIIANVARVRTPM